MAPTPDSDSDGTYHHGTAFYPDLSSDARPGSDSCTNATHKGSDHLGPGTIGIRGSSSPSRPGHHWPGPSTSSTSGQVGPRADPLISSRSGIPLIRVSSFPQIPPLASHSFFPYNCHKRDFLFALQTLHVCWLHADICSIISTPALSLLRAPVTHPSFIFSPVYTPPALLLCRCASIHPCMPLTVTSPPMLPSWARPHSGPHAHGSGPAGRAAVTPFKPGSRPHGHVTPCARPRLGRSQAAYL